MESIGLFFRRFVVLGEIIGCIYFTNDFISFILWFLTVTIIHFIIFMAWLYVFDRNLYYDYKDPDWIEPRKRLFDLIEKTPNLIWQLLTKRPENVVKMIGSDCFYNNLWIGVTVENQDMLNHRLVAIKNIHEQLICDVVFLSCEPLLSSLDIKDIREYIHWVICGGESGVKARKMNVEWVTELKNQCKHFKIPFFFKQWGSWKPEMNHELYDWFYKKVSKEESGRLLYGKEYNEFPEY
jgi:protein gp37